MQLYRNVKELTKLGEDFYIQIFKRENDQEFKRMQCFGENKATSKFFELEIP